MPLTFVNVHGQVITDQLSIAKSKKAAQRPKPEEKSFHKGWKVTGIPPGEMEAARDANARLQRMAQEAGGREIKPFDEQNYLQNHKGKAVRNKPYEIESSAKECAALAERSGWLRVRIEEVKRDLRGQGGQHEL